MALQFQNVEIDLLGISQHDDRRKTLPGKLERADNVEIVKKGALTIRRGYARANVERTADDTWIHFNGDKLFHRVAAWRGGLVVIGHTRIFGVTSPLNQIPVTSGTTSLVDHGRIACTGIRSQVIATSESSDGTGTVE